MKTAAFERFWLNSQFLTLHSTRPSTTDAAKFNINPEGKLMREAQNIGDELQIMAGHLKTQYQVVEEFSALFAERALNSLVLRDTDTSAQTRKLEQLLKQTRSRQGDIEELIQGAASVYRSVSSHWNRVTSPQIANHGVAC
jgi:hypothetical protein